MRFPAGIVLLFFCAAMATDISWSGNAQYRLRYEQAAITSAPDTLRCDLTHRYSWFLKGVVQAKENLDFGIKFSNPSGSSTDAIVLNDSFPSNRNHAPIVMREFYFHWTAGMVSLHAARIPVAASTILELTSYESRRYAEVGSDQWSTLTDNAQTGLLLDIAAFKNDPLSLRPSLLTAVATDPGESLLEPVERRRLDQWKTVLSLQAGLFGARVTVTPAAYLRTNIAQSADGSESNHAAAGALDVTVAASRATTVTAGMAAGSYDNSAKAADTLVAQVEPVGLLARLVANVKPGFGVVTAALSFGQWSDDRNAPDRANRLLFGALKYGIPLANLTIEPYLRAWYGFNNQDSAIKFRFRAELSAIGAF
ncbi:MAG: hypothetical protein JXA71_12940 [Chitinispirillaceae bacterium]|nr:hypothetical protein [Chitinispirillaceae bacterium]